METNALEPVDPLIESCRKFSTSTLSDAMGHANCMHSAIRPLVPQSKIFGPAFTVCCYPGDNLACHYAVSRAVEGDVLVVDGAGNTEVALWGSLLSRVAVLRRLGGAIIDGAVRDIDELREIGYSVYARAVTPRSGYKTQQGQVNIPISCGGVPVCNGDIVVADADGVLIIPRRCMQDVALKAKGIAIKEAEFAAAIERGSTTYELLGSSRR